jgi:hypothetical protein
VRLSDLLTYTVRDADGVALGAVSDVRIAQDGPIVRGVQAAFRVEALVVGRGGLAERLGYIRSRVEGPWLLRVVFARLEHRVRIVDVADIERWEDEARVIHVRRATEQP